MWLFHIKEGQKYPMWDCGLTKDGGHVCDMVYF